MYLCPSCRTPVSVVPSICPRCSRIVTKPVPFWKTAPFIIGAVVLMSLVVGLFEKKKNAGIPLTPTSTPSTVSSSSPASNSKVDTNAAINRFRAKLDSLPKGLILSVEPSGVQGVARVQVSNLWFSFRPHERRQATQMMANVWEGEMQGEHSILHIYDITGQEIAGTRAFGGVWISDE